MKPLLTISLVILIVLIIGMCFWGIGVVKRQIDFGDRCVKLCLDNNIILDCSAEFYSVYLFYPMGRCVAKKEFILMQEEFRSSK